MQQDLSPYRILYADDQVNVARTLASLLEGAGAYVDFASDGQSALKRLRSEVFDLVIVDMKMPPGEWGGIWLIEQLSKHPRVPSVALSGQGGQEQTIHAHRAGAHDWVQKENALNELAERVSHVLVDVERVATSTGLAKLPTPIAASFERVDSAHVPNVVLRLVFQAVEVFLRFTALIGFAEASARGIDGPLRGLPGSKLVRPSMGVWNAAVDSLRKVLPEESAFGELARCIDPQVIGPIIKSRNDVQHGIEPSERRAQELLAPMRLVLGRLITRAVAYWSHQVFLPKAMEGDSASFSVRGPRLSGPGLASHGELWQVAGSVHTGLPYLFAQDGHAVPLGPWLHVREGRTHGQWDTLLFGGVKCRNIRSLATTDLLEYSDIKNGEEHVLPPGGATLLTVPTWFGVSP